MGNHSGVLKRNIHEVRMGIIRTGLVLAVINNIIINVFTESDMNEAADCVGKTRQSRETELMLLLLLLLGRPTAAECRLALEESARLTADFRSDFLFIYLNKCGFIFTLTSQWRCRCVWVCRVIPYYLKESGDSG